MKIYRFAVIAVLFLGLMLFLSCAVEEDSSDTGSEQTEITSDNAGDSSAATDPQGGKGMRQGRWDDYVIYNLITASTQ